MTEVTVVGAGLAGCEAAWQLAQRDVAVRLVEMRPVRMTPAHKTGDFAELVCSNSLRSDALTNAVGVLKEEMRAHCAKGNTVFFSTHVLEVAEKLCDRVGIIRNGELAAVGTLEELRAQAENGESSLEDIFLDIVNGGA